MLAHDGDRKTVADELRLGQSDRWVTAQVVPFAVFMIFLLVLQLFGSFFGQDHPSSPWWRKWPEQWLYPIQTLVCLVLLVRRWRYYEFRWSAKWCLIGALMGVIGIGFWIAPTHLYDVWGLQGETEGWMKWCGIAARTKGFNPAEAFGSGTPLYWMALLMRFTRAVVVVALVEEIFWRSFLMRFAADWEGDYWKRPFGQHSSWLVFAIVTGLFVFAHAPVDYLGAIVYGSLTWILCIWSKNLGACITMHAIANLLMGIYAITRMKYGLW
jgi:uncharacterized protein